MKLRKLENKDAPFMLEWMHDVTVVENLKTDFLSLTMEDCKKFIDSAQNISENIHLAIVDEEDTYMGTVSLKHITNVDAEFAITIRRQAMGKNYSKYGMEEMLRIGIEELGLKRIYWCVDRKNIRALKFYDKNGYERVNMHLCELVKSIKSKGVYSEEQINEFVWYIVYSRGDKR